jgi:aminoglycoside phosphotransferase (APT) family kinase protein
MPPTWTPEVVVLPDLARSLIEQQFPTLAPVNVEPLGVGWDNTAFQVNDVYAFRFPRRQVVLPLIEAETRVMPGIAPRLPLPVPVVTFHGQPSAAFGWPFIGHRMIRGQTACSAALTVIERIAAAEPVGRFLAALHSIPTEEAKRLGARPDPIAKLDMGKRLPKAHELVAQLAASGLVEDAATLRQMLDAVPSSYVARSDTLVHSDLYVRHLLVDEDRRLAGVIDWGDVHLGDPAVDLTIALTVLPPAGRPIFCAAYGPVEECAWRVARGRALWHTLNLLEYGRDRGDADLMREAQLALRYVMES